MKIDYLQALKRVETAQGAWLMHGQEPLLEQNLLQTFRTHWAQQGIERQRFELNGVNDWKQVFAALNSLSLFSTQLAVEAHGNIKPDASGIKQLKQYLQQEQNNLLVVVMPKQDANSLKSNFIQNIEANGVLVNLAANYAQDRQSILKVEAEKLGIDLEAEAWRWLEQHHEHNLLAAKNSLMRVADTYPDLKVLGITQLQECLQDQSRYSSFDLSDALIAGHLGNATKIYHYLLESGEPFSLILWTVSKDMRLLMQLYEQPHNAVQLGIWKNKINNYQKALSRLHPSAFLHWPQLLLRTDAAIKGMSQENPEHLIQQCIAEVCGQRLFPAWN